MYKFELFHYQHTRDYGDTNEITVTFDIKGHAGSLCLSHEDLYKVVKSKLLDKNTKFRFDCNEKDRAWCYFDLSGTEYTVAAIEKEMEEAQGVLNEACGKYMEIKSVMDQFKN